jgi:hypothetical protein
MIGVAAGEGAGADLNADEGGGFGCRGGNLRCDLISQCGNADRGGGFEEIATGGWNG